MLQKMDGKREHLQIFTRGLRDKTPRFLMKDVENENADRQRYYSFFSLSLPLARTIERHQLIGEAE